MSYVTNIIVSCGCGEEETAIVKSVLDEFTTYSEVMPFQEVAENMTVGGNKNLEVVLFIGAFNRFEEDYFFEKIKSLKEKVDKCYFERLQIFIKDENMELWEVYNYSRSEIKNPHLLGRG